MRKNQRVYNMVIIQLKLNLDFHIEIHQVVVAVFVKAARSTDMKTEI